MIARFPLSWRPRWWLDFLKLVWPMGGVAARLTRIPILGRILTRAIRPFFGRKHFHISYLPIQAKIEAPQSTVLPRAILEPLIRASSHRAVIRRCSCRDSKGCRNFPTGESCLMLGEDARRIRPHLARALTVDEALAHVEERISLGLIPMTGRVRMDDLFYGAPNRGRMLTVCFCCTCCCSVLHAARFFPDEMRKSIVKVQGLRVRVDDARCIGCGACVNACPQRAITLDVREPKAAIEDAFRRLRERVDVSAHG